jgi:gamma-glutamylcyclotransferase
MTLVFQYGSNCLESQINSKDRLCGDARFIDIAETVDDFQLAFDVWSTNRQCAASDIVQSPGNKVWGALYEVPDFLTERKTAAAHNRKSLDAIEGEGGNYRRHTIAVRRDNGQIVTALTYRVQNPKPDLKTNLEYVGYIVEGLRERGVRADYIEHVKNIAQTNNPTIAALVQEL